MNEIPIFKFALREDIKEYKNLIPTKGEPLATGYDCFAAQKNKEDIIVKPGQTVKIPLGFRVFCPPGWFYYLHPRSSFFLKKHMHTLVGVVDEAFNAETNLVATYLPDAKDITQDLIIKFGDPIGQIIPVKRKEMEINEVSNEEMDELYKSRGAKRNGGFGSTWENK